MSKFLTSPLKALSYSAFPISFISSFLIIFFFFFSFFTSISVSDAQTQFDAPNYKKVSLVPKETLEKHKLKPSRLGLVHVGVRFDSFTYQENEKYSNPTMFGVGFASTPLGTKAVWRSLSLWTDGDQFQLETMVWMPIPKYSFFDNLLTPLVGLRLGLQAIKTNYGPSGYGYYDSFYGGGYSFSESNYAQPDPIYFGLSLGCYGSYVSLELDLDWSQMATDQYDYFGEEETELALSRIGLKLALFL